MMVSVGFLSAFEHNVAPSVTNRFFTSQLWPQLLVTDFVGIVAHDRAADFVNDDAALLDGLVAASAAGPTRGRPSPR